MELAYALCIALVSSSIGCGPSKEEQCKTLVAAVEKADAARVRPAQGKLDRDKFLGDMVAAKRELAATEVSDEKLVALREREWKALEDFINAQREILDAKIPAELDEAIEARRRVMKNHEVNVAELGTYCGTNVVLASTSQPAPSVAPSATQAPSPMPTPAPAPPSASPTLEAWTTFRHPKEPFEAQYFEPPEVGERKGPNSITHAAIADDDHRMFSAAYIVFPSPPTYDCNILTRAHVQGTEDNFGCKRSNESMAEAGEARTLEATLTCSKGETMLKRVRCVPKASEKRVVMLDAQALYLRAWNPAEARRFADSAKLLER